jgi:hypothetical protein
MITFTPDKFLHFLGIIIDWGLYPSYDPLPERYKIGGTVFLAVVYIHSLSLSSRQLSVEKVVLLSVYRLKHA